MSKFKVGDRVRCVENSQWDLFPGEKNRTYVVSALGDIENAIKLEGCDQRYSSSDRRFEFATKERVDMFKPGDKVKCVVTSLDNGGFTKGKVYTVTRCDKGFIQIDRDDNDCTDNGWYTEYFELVESLEDVCRRVNEGLGILYDRRQEVEVARAGDNKWAKPEDILVSFRVAPKPVFEPFYVGKGWIVQLIDHTVCVGCQDFNASELKFALESLCKQKSTSITSTKGTFKASRECLYFCDKSNNEFTVTWEEADKILAALEKAGV